VGQGSYLSAVQNSGKSLSWDELIELIGDAEAALTNLKTVIIDEKHLLENRIRILERKLREAENPLG
jgi:hypothetical protein